MSGRWLLAAVLAVVSASVTKADSMFSFGTATLGYWASVVDARALGMGGANFAVVDDDNVVLGNPAAVTGHPHTTWSVVGAFERREVEDISGLRREDDRRLGTGERSGVQMGYRPLAGWRCRQ